MIITGNCKICRSPDARIISLLIHDGVKYAEIIGRYPDLKLTKQMISYHRNHFLAEIETCDVGDHEYIDRLKRLGNAYINRGLDGSDLSLSQCRIIQVATNAILFRKNVQDKSKEASSLEELIKGAASSQWEYERV